MDRDQFDRLSLHVAAAGTRRDALRLLVAGALAGVAGHVATAQARKRRNRRRGKQERVRGEQAELCTTLCVDCSAKPIQPGANLARCDFDDESFTDGLNLSSANLSKACFARSELRGARFNGADVSRACFADADLTGASFLGANVSRAVFCGADLRGADFRGSNVTSAQLACATVGCDTILPNGRPAVTCAAGETCCDGICVRTGSDPDNCGACGNACGACRFCNFGRCDALADGRFDCNRVPLEQVGDSVCTAGPNTGICDGGVCNCGDGAYDAAANACRCGPVEADDCAGAGQCCEVSTTCLSDGSFVALADCVDCDGGGSPTNLCCDYACQGTEPDKFVCIPNASPASPSATTASRVAPSTTPTSSPPAAPAEPRNRACNLAPSSYPGSRPRAGLPRPDRRGRRPGRPRQRAAGERGAVRGAARPARRPVAAVRRSHGQLRTVGLRAIGGIITLAVLFVLRELTSGVLKEAGKDLWGWARRRRSRSNRHCRCRWR